MSAAEEVSQRVFDELICLPVARSVAVTVALAMIAGAARGYRELSEKHGKSREERLRLLKALGDDFERPLTDN